MRSIKPLATERTSPCSIDGSARDRELTPGLTHGVSDHRTKRPPSVSGTTVCGYAFELRVLADLSFTIDPTLACDVMPDADAVSYPGHVVIDSCADAGGEPGNRLLSGDHRDGTQMRPC
jgi:hypothetical protein